MPHSLRIAGRSHEVLHNAPFFLFDDARGANADTSLLFSDLAASLAVGDPARLEDAFAWLRDGLAQGLHAAGWLAFEAGYALEPKLAARYRPPPDGEPLLWFGLFRDRRALGPLEVEGLCRASLSVPPRCALGLVQPATEPDDYAAALDRVLRFIEAGDVYQINLTFPAALRAEGDPLALYDRLRRSQRGGHSVLASTGAHWLLSTSPELFFTLEPGGRLTAMPMKGTAPRTEDESAGVVLAADPKNRAENLMIVDLLRNDLSRVAAPGSVQVPRLFEVSALPTLWQMTSTITAQVQPGRDAIDVLRTLFPCGSITGAPKIRAMEIIRDLEPEPRGLYTGAIGWMSPDGASSFNVAIRTLLLQTGGTARLGLGSGVVADSVAADEWRECLDKAQFLDTEIPPFDLFETLRWTPDTGFARLDAHLERLSTSARRFGFVATPDAWRTVLADASTQWNSPMRVRLLVSRFGAASVQARALVPLAEPLGVVLAPVPLDVPRPWLVHKTSHRGFYDDARMAWARAAGCDEVLFCNRQGHLTEGSFTTLFVARDGVLLTPPLADGVLPGILRAELLADGRAVEARLTAADLDSGEIWLGNSLRGLMRGRLLKPAVSG